jgi:hypothetical protein
MFQRVEKHTLEICPSFSAMLRRRKGWTATLGVNVIKHFFVVTNREANKLEQGGRKLMGENLKVVRAKFSTLS